MWRGGAVLDRASGIARFELAVQLEPRHVALEPREADERRIGRSRSPGWRPWASFQLMAQPGSMHDALTDGSTTLARPASRVLRATKFAGLNAPPASWQNDRPVALDHRRARRHLMAADPVMADLIRRAGPCRLGSQPRRRPVLPAAAGDRLAAALDQGRRDHLRPAVRAVPASRPDARTPAGARRRRAARRRPQHAEGALRARPVIAGPRPPARPGAARHHSGR